MISAQVAMIVAMIVSLLLKLRTYNSIIARNEEILMAGSAEFSSGAKFDPNRNALPFTHDFEEVEALLSCSGAARLDAC